MSKSDNIVTITDRSWKPSDIHYWFNPKDSRYNSSIIFNGTLSRLRAAMLIIKDGNKILLGEEVDEPGLYSLPGGAINKNESIVDAAVRETKEEVKILVNDAEETGIDYCEMHDEVKDWVINNVPENEWWYNYYSCLIISEYKEQYLDTVSSQDADQSMLNTCKFYNIKDVINNPSFKYAWKLALYNYGYIDEKPINEELNKNKLQTIVEANRLELISKSRRGKLYKDASKGNRWTRRKNCKVANTVKDYNKIDMDKFWKKDILNFGINVAGESDSYVVTVEFYNVLNKIQQNIKNNKYKIDVNTIYKALFESLNSSDVKISCNCPDFKYRLSYWATRNNYNAGEAENREAKITNPKDNLGAACKHILCALNNATWLKNISSVINNYINYMKERMEYNYGKFIFPKLYGMTYEKAIQLTIDDFDADGNLKTKLESDESLINLSNALGRERGKFKKGSNKNPVTQLRREENK